MLVRAAIAALGGPQDALARQMLLGLQSDGGDGTALQSVIGRRARVTGVAALDDATAFEAWLAAPDSPALIRLQAAAIAGWLLQAGQPRRWLQDALAATCAVVLTDARGTFAIGTGVVVQADPPVVLTNRHVVDGLMSAATGDGLTVRSDLHLEVAFGNAHWGAHDARRVTVRLADVRDGPDMALLHLAPTVPPLTAAVPPGPGTASPPDPGLALVIGFPASPVGQQEKRLFQRTGLLGHKTLSIGLLRFGFDGGSFPDLAPAVTWHDCATCAGFSGSGVFTLSTGRLAALHFEGAEATVAGFANLAVDLARKPVGLPPNGTAAPHDPAPGSAAAQAGAPALPFPVARSQGEARALSVQRDLPDPRDLPYVPDLTDLPRRHAPAPGLPVADQGTAPTCVGHALAAAINLQLGRRGAQTLRASPRMLYELARAHDNLPDPLGGGSTLRGAIKGFFHNGVVPEEPPEVEHAPDWGLTRDRAKRAAAIQLGTYRRVGRDFDAVHSAIRGSGAVLASARIHRGWEAPVKGRIRRSADSLGGHAFVIVGYDQTGFIVLNSWGEGWGGWRGRPGLAHWSYGDAAETLLDAWVLRLAVPSTAVARILKTDRAARASTALRRADVIGHMMPLAGGQLHDGGKFGFGAEIHAETAAHLRSIAAAPRPRYRDLVIVCHDLTVDRDRVAERTSRLREVCKPQRIWPLSVTLDTALGRTFDTVVTHALADLSEVPSPTLRRIGLVEEIGPVVRSLWARLSDEIAQALAPDLPGGAALAAIRGAADGLRLHLVGEGLGSLVAGWLAARTFAGARIDGLFLLDPTLPDADFRALIAPAVHRAQGVGHFGEAFAEQGATGFAGTGLSRAALLADLVARPFHAGMTSLPPARRQLPHALAAPGALDGKDGVLALAQTIRARASGRAR
ncbi:MAG: trypsin-like peptidase domain-containing protein [Rhodobacteraceae bacterium]|nr:trypsin-like peptidase domain-containing protein [Paracoccaceae bacterium]